VPARHILHDDGTHPPPPLEEEVLPPLDADEGWLHVPALHVPADVPPRVQSAHGEPVEPHVVSDDGWQVFELSQQPMQELSQVPPPLLLVLVPLEPPSSPVPPLLLVLDVMSPEDDEL
jgi:hypothetical protein